MALVDYSDSDESEEVISPPTKKQKTSDSHTAAITAKDVLPPLPSAFHDLYASTVRVSASDDPTMHQGRKRVNPHKVGHWPSHLYIEWHPTPPERATLTKLLSTLQSTLPSPPSSSSLSSPSSPPSNPQSITSFLTSDLGAPQPLHISLSRPIVLSTAQKAAFLSDLETSIRTSGIAPFEVRPLALQWHRTEESSRSFLVLRVGSRQPSATTTITPTTTLDKGKKQEDAGEEHAGQNTVKKQEEEEEEEEEAEGEGNSSANNNNNNNNNNNKNTSANPHLTPLLQRSNALVTAFGQPALYAFAGREGEAGSADDAFHVSIAWSPAPPSAEVRRLTDEAFDGACDDGVGVGVGTTIRDAVRGMRVRVEGIKAKIGNVVTHVPLPDARGWRNDDRGRGLFGV
ncbi:U6 snRNA phosphodiesterase Usb1 [Xylaria sp. FL1777]|nr:U6 snRNA phosphodiesterase Usb1 [Xylaria sp. FL1777]